MLKLLLVGMLLPTGGEAGPEIVAPHATYGHLGAVRPKGEGILPGDIAYFTFGIKNLKLDENGKAQYSVAIEVRDAKNKLFYEQKPYNAVAQNVFGGDTLPCSAHVVIPIDAEPGVVHWKVTVRDRATDKSVETKGEGKILAPSFGIVRVGTFADAEGKAPIPPVGVVGSTLYLDFAAVNFMRDAMKKPDVQVQLRVLDDQGKPTLTKPQAGRIRDDIAEDERVVPVQFALTLNRPGNFTIELTARCVVCGVDRQIRLPVRVLPME
jgi:hypothetical protein